MEASSINQNLPNKQGFGLTAAEIYQFNKPFLNEVFSGNQHLIKENYRVVGYYQRQQYRDAWNVTVSQDGIILYIKNIQLNMKRFLQFNWSNVQILKLINCKIDDQSWKLFVSHINLFPRLQDFNICDNKIRNVKKEDLQKISKIKVIWFTVSDYPNPLSEQSIVMMQNYRQTHRIKIALFKGDYID